MRSDPARLAIPADDPEAPRSAFFAEVLPWATGIVLAIALVLRLDGAGARGARVAQRDGSTRRFFHSKLGSMRTAQLAEPALISKLQERGLIVLEDPDEARKEDWD